MFEAFNIYHHFCSIGLNTILSNLYCCIVPSHKLETQITEAMVPISLVLLLVQSSYMPILTAG